jgi:hypothetical protein
MAGSMAVFGGDLGLKFNIGMLTAIRYPSGFALTHSLKMKINAEVWTTHPPKRF